jgi:VanZ family protein
MKRPRARDFDPVVAAWQWRWAHDRWLSKGGTILPYDKLEHFLIYFLAGFLLSFKFAAEIVIILLFAIGLLWEIKDALMPYEKYGWWGGEGFSWKDLIANIIGIALGLALRSMISLDSTSLS